VGAAATRPGKTFVLANTGKIGSERTLWDALLFPEKTPV
jgi:hypothetical protein